jgi:hemoglobin-like flavoprotein
MVRVRKKTWDQKVQIVKESFLRASVNSSFPSKFYANLFFLNPKIKKYFEKTDFEHQDKALMHGLNFLFGYLDQDDDHSRKQIGRIAITHSSQGLKIHPHHYYYWIEALILTARETDPSWTDGMDYYWREVVNYPVSFIISQFFNSDKK